MRKPAFIALLGALAILPFDLSAARVTLRDGTVIYGEFVSGTPQVITLRDRNGVQRRLNVSQVATLEFSGYRGDEFGRGTAFREESGTSANPSGNPIVLPAGASIPVRTSEEIASGRGAALGRAYAAVVQEDVVDADGHVVIPRGAEALLIIRAVGSGENAGENMVLDLNSVLFDGRRYDLDPVSPRRSAGLGPNRRSGEMAGGGAVVASVVGAVVGAPGSGGAGAATVPGMQVLTRGYEIHVPADTELNFRIAQPVYLDERR